LSKPAPPKVDENCVVLNARCQRTSAPYLIKFQRNAGSDEWAEIIYEGRGAKSERAFSLAGAFAITAPDEYRELSLETPGDKRLAPVSWQEIHRVRVAEISSVLLFALAAEFTACTEKE
jgi:hypothetical protein